MAPFGNNNHSFYSRIIEVMRDCVRWEIGIRISVDWVNVEIWNLTNQFGMAFGEPPLTIEQMQKVGYLAGKAYHKSNYVVLDDYLSFFLQTHRRKRLCLRSDKAGRSMSEF